MMPSSSLQALELKVPPPLVGLIGAALMYGLAKILPEWRWQIPLSPLLGALTALMGVLLDSLGLLAFVRAKTTVNPLKPANTSTMVQSGIYRYTRNPMYLGMLSMLLGWAIYLAQPLALLVLPIFVVYLTQFQIIPEERFLREKFAATYDDYVHRVRRWV